MFGEITASVIGTLLVLLFVQVIAVQWMLRVFFPWLKTKLMVNLDLKGTWVGMWEWVDQSGDIRDEIRIEKQSGNDIHGSRLVFLSPMAEYELRGFYMDGLLVAHFWNKDRKKRYGGSFLLRLGDKGETLSGKVMYPEGGNLNRIVSKEIYYKRE